MGGRGSFSESNERPEGSSGNSKQKWTGNVAQPIPPSGHLREAIGTKGKPFKPSDALVHVNPNYDPRTSEFSENCQRCVVAYELRRRGYDVTALPTYDGDTMGRHAYGLNHRYQMAFRHARVENVGANNPDRVQRNVESRLLSWGNGSRAIVSIPGHVFNAENRNGKIIYVDAQTGIRYTSNRTFGRINRGGLRSVSVMRTDNLRISDRARELVTLRRR